MKKLTRTGNSLALVLDKALLDLMHLDETTPVHVDFDGARIILTPAAPDERKKFEAAKALSHRRYSKAYKRLAE